MSVTSLVVDCWVVLQRRLSWWPNIEIMYSKSSELRNLFTDTLNKVTQMNHTPLRLSTVTTTNYAVSLHYPTN